MSNQLPIPREHVEIQLGHLCNNRCVFCVSGQLSEQGRAGQIGAEDAIERLSRARSEGAKRVTLLGGEPTLQKSFFDVLKATQDLEFEEVIIFTNGVMASKAKFLERVMGVGEFTWRFSLQGADEASHDAVTRNPGSFARITAAMRSLRERGQKVTSNLCVTSVNVSSLPAYPAIVQSIGIEDVHLDMVRPLDAGERTDDYLTSILPPYTVVAEYVEEMLERFPPGAEAHVGNLPYCVLPERANHIFHDGMNTLTFAANGRNGLDQGWDKYETKRRDKRHPGVCTDCVFMESCNGIFDKYRESHGLEGIQAVSREQLWSTEKSRLGAFRLLASPFLTALETADPYESGTKVFAQIHRESPTWLQVTFDSGEGQMHQFVVQARHAKEGVAVSRTDRLSLHLGAHCGSRPVQELEHELNWLLEVLLQTEEAGQVETPVSRASIRESLKAQQMLQMKLSRSRTQEPRVQVSPSLTHATLVKSPEDGGWVSVTLFISDGKVRLSYETEPTLDSRTAKERLMEVIRPLQ